MPVNIFTTTMYLPIIYVFLEHANSFNYFRLLHRSIIITGIFTSSFR
jgi:hypothetical protein